MDIHIEETEHTDGKSVFSVRVTDDDGSTSEHTTTVPADDAERLAGSRESARALVEASFRFLLAREPKESILSRFSLADIKAYFPEYETEMREKDW